MIDTSHCRYCTLKLSSLLTLIYLIDYRLVMVTEEVNEIFGVFSV